MFFSFFFILSAGERLEDELRRRGVRRPDLFATLFDFLLLFPIIYFTFIVLKKKVARFWGKAILLVFSSSRSRPLLPHGLPLSNIFQEKGGHYRTTPLMVTTGFFLFFSLSVFRCRFPLVVVVVVVVVVCPEFVVEVWLNGHLSLSLGSLLNSGPQKQPDAVPLSVGFSPFHSPSPGGFPLKEEEEDSYGIVTLYFISFLPTSWVGGICIKSSSLVGRKMIARESSCKCLFVSAYFYIFKKGAYKQNSNKMGWRLRKRASTTVTRWRGVTFNLSGNYSGNNSTLNTYCIDV